MLEAAVAFTVLSLLLFGAMDFARLLSTAITVANAAFAGAQYGAQSPAHASQTDAIQSAAAADASGVADFSATAARVCACTPGGPAAPCADSCPTRGAPIVYIQVIAAANFRTLFPYPLLPRSVPVSTKAMVRVE